jgi:hypothetical protein
MNRDQRLVRAVVIVFAIVEGLVIAAFISIQLGLFQ